MVPRGPGAADFDPCDADRLKLAGSHREAWREARGEVRRIHCVDDDSIPGQPFAEIWLVWEETGCISSRLYEETELPNEFVFPATIVAPPDVKLYTVAGTTSGKPATPISPLSRASRWLD